MKFVKAIMRMWICSGLISFYPDNIGHRKRTFVFRHIFLSYLNADSFRVHAYTLLVYSYNCNWDLQYIDRPTTPSTVCRRRRSIIGFLLHPIQILNTPHSTTGLVSLQFLCVSYYLPASLASCVSCNINVSSFGLHKPRCGSHPSTISQYLETLVKLGHVLLQCVYIINVIVNLCCLELL